MVESKKIHPGFKILTLNCWGLPFLTPHKNRRLDAISEIIRNGNWDVIALQEVWLKSDQQRLIRNSGFKHSVVFDAGSRFIGSGMILLSKFKILKSDFHRFRVMGFPHRLDQGDFHSTKGVGFALLETPQGELPVFTTHLIAKYAPRHERDVNRVFRIAQILELVFYVRRMATPKSFVLCGDLNSQEQDLELQALYALFGVPRNLHLKLRSNKKRIDHIICGATHKELDLRVSNGSLVFRQPFSGEGIPYSDHHGVSATVRRAVSEIDATASRRALERTYRYMTYSIDVVKQLNHRISLIPLAGWANNYFMKPQLAYIEALMGMLETDLKQAESEHPLRLKGAI
jgi:endonuclease/exonuclease/phosphatase family metal-dependent hydrolase